MTVWRTDGVTSETVPIDDRGFQYGDGLFETIAVRRGVPRYLDAHLRRLAAGIARLGMPRAPESALADEVTSLAAGCDFGVAKIIITRGSGPRGYRAPASPVPRRMVGIVTSEPAPRQHYERGIGLRLCRTRISTNQATAGIKTLGRLDQVLARSEWDDPQIAEGLMLDAEGCVVSGTMSNFFFVRDECLCTPSLASAGVAGIMRAAVMEQALDVGIAVRETRVHCKDLREDDELFVTNSQIGIWPVGRFRDRSREPGAVTRSLMRRLAAAGVEECSP